ncbi:hypothetical protein [Bradyrhizobium sp. B117]|uniref:hypothetical protein n=1 Tax=Bradyrhizobium sp. B117 TaxID=3140246 RepID=UPI003183902C
MTTEDEKKPGKERHTINEMPLYPSEAQIARWVIAPKTGSAQQRCWRTRRAYRKINELMGGRFWPAVIAFFYGWQHISLDHTRVEPSRWPT